MPKRRFLFVSIDGLCSDLAWRVSEEGHEVRLFIRSEAQREVGDGFVTKSTDWEGDLARADVVVFDDTLGQGVVAEGLRGRGHAVVGGTAYTDRLEDDRDFGQRELAAAGVRTLPCAAFERFDDAIAYVRANPAAYVFKPCGEAANLKRLLYVGQRDDGEDLVQLLGSYRGTWDTRVTSFQLQRRVLGVEVGVTAFFDGTRFLAPVCVNFEHKRLFPGELGPMTGEMGTSLFWSPPNRLFREVLLPMESRLREVGYHGAIDVNCIATEEAAWPLEFTCRFGFPTILIQSESLVTPLGELLEGLARGGAPDFRARPGFTVGVNVRVPPYPYDDPVIFDSFAKERRVDFRDGRRDGVHIQDMKRVGDDWVLTGVDACPLLVAGHGLTMREARAQTYARIGGLLLPGMYYRNDIGERWGEDGDRLLAWGWLGA
ncbi:MAG: phosphoribosylamine--glycine ligase [Myxococcota bacterium]